MSKYIEDDWGDRFIGSDDIFYLVNDEVVHSDYITEIPTTLYRDNNGDYIDEDEIVKFNGIDEYINFLKRSIKYFKNEVDRFEKLGYPNIADKYRSILNTYIKLLTNVKEG
jgi:hypothetical protein